MRREMSQVQRGRFNAGNGENANTKGETPGSLLMMNFPCEPPPC